MTIHIRNDDNLPLCGRANFDREDLVSEDSFRLATPAVLDSLPEVDGPRCWECGSIVGIDTTIDSFLANGGYSTPEEWALDSDYHKGADDNWYDEQGQPIDIFGAIEGAIEASGFTS